jgi:hypothetical protein
MNTESNQPETTTTDGISAATNRRRRGYVARLPKPVRDQINSMLDDGIPYTAIAKEIQKSANPPLTVALTDNHIASWKAGGFQDWLKERQQVEAQRTLFEGITNLVAKTETEELPDLTIKLLAARVFGVLTQLTPTELRENATSTPKNLPRLLSLVPKLSHEALATRKYRHALKTERTEPMPADVARTAEY